MDRKATSRGISLLCSDIRVPQRRVSGEKASSSVGVKEADGGGMWKKLQGPWRENKFFFDVWRENKLARSIT